MFCHLFPFPFCLEFSLLTTQSREITTLLSEEGHNNVRTAKTPLIERTDFDAAFFIYLFIYCLFVCLGFFLKNFWSESDDYGMMQRQHLAQTIVKFFMPRGIYIAQVNV